MIRLPTEHFLLINFANSLDPDQARKNVRPDLDPICLTLWMYSWKKFSEKSILKKNQQTTKKHEKNYLGGKDLSLVYWLILLTLLLSASFSKSNFSKYCFRNTNRELNSLDPDQAQLLIFSDLIWVQTVYKSYQKTKLLARLAKEIKILLNVKLWIFSCPSILIFVQCAQNISIEFPSHHKFYLLLDFRLLIKFVFCTLLRRFFWVPTIYLRNKRIIFH